MILFLLGLFVGAALGVLLLSLFAANRIRDAYTEGRIDEVLDAVRAPLP